MTEERLHPRVSNDNVTRTEYLRGPNEGRLKAALVSFISGMENNTEMEFEIVMIEPCIAVDFRQRPIPEKVEIQAEDVGGLEDILDAD